MPTHMYLLPNPVVSNELYSECPANGRAVWRELPHKGGFCGPTSSNNEIERAFQFRDEAGDIRIQSRTINTMTYMDTLALVREGTWVCYALYPKLLRIVACTGIEITQNHSHTTPPLIVLCILAVSGSMEDSRTNGHSVPRVGVVPSMRLAT